MLDRALVQYPLGIALFAVFSILGTAFAQHDVADVPAAEHKLDANLRYFLIGAEHAAPADGYKLLVVLPGGDGGEAFQPFLKRIHQNVLGEEYLMLQLIAPKWNRRQQVVWPTKGLREAGMKTATEDFIAAAVEDVKQRTKINDKNVFALGWSSGGPAVYAASVAEGTPLTGSFVAMSVFKPAHMGDLSRADDHAYYILHSKEDPICPYRMAEQARDQLGKAGAEVTLATYAGGHGWRGNVVGNLRDGVTWLEEHAASETESNTAP